MDALPRCVKAESKRFSRRWAHRLQLCLAKRLGEDLSPVFAMNRVGAGVENASGLSFRIAAEGTKIALFEILVEAVDCVERGQI